MLDSRDNHYTMESAGACNSFRMHVKQCVRYGSQKREKVIPPGIEPGTLSVLDSRDNHYTMESAAACNSFHMCVKQCVKVW